MKEVKFVEYTGKWPNLCRGELTLEIDGQRVTFNPFKTKGYGLCSGGSCGFNDDYTESYINYGPWTISLPEEYKDIEKQVEKLINENIEEGCCGGCL